jgi:hypothetical protein
MTDAKLLKSNAQWAIEQEAKQGLAQTVAIFRQCNMSDSEIADLFRSIADEIDPPMQVPDLEIN